MLRIGLALLAGHGCIHSFATLPAAQPWAWILAALLAVFALLRSKLGVVFLLGIAWAWLHAAIRLSDDLPTTLEGADLVVRGHVASLPGPEAADPQFEFDVTAAPDGVPGRIRLTWYDSAQRLLPGESWQLVVRLKRRNGLANPGGFDYERHLFQQHIGATGYVRSDERNVRLAPPAASYAIARVRAWIARRIALAVPGDPMLGILQGLAVGDTQAMSVEQWRVFAATGTTHLMAISGLHISMVAALAAWLGGGITRWRAAQSRRLTAIHGQFFCGSLAAIAYSLLAGLSVPTQRTLVMLCIYFAARALRRELDVANALGAALIGVLLIDPFAPLTVGAWLSFGAVAMILLGVGGRLEREGAIKSFARVQLAVTVGLTPVLIAAFGSLSLISPLANAIAIPSFTLAVVPLTLIGAALASVSQSCAGIVLGLASGLLQVFWPALLWLSQLPLAMWHFPQLPLATGAALTVGALLLVLPGIVPTRIAAVLLCMPAVLWRPATPARGEFRLTLLDVGQGLSAVIHTQSHVLVYDAGPAFRSGRDTGELVILPFLRSQGVRRLDMLMVSHGDLDHRGGMHSILAGMPVEQMLAGPSVKAPLARLGLCQRGQRWSWDGVEFEVLHPTATTQVSDNDSSCVLRVAASGGASLLLTGDIQRSSEAELVAAGLQHADIVVAPHHGSRTSSTAAFVHATQPQLVLFATGYRNRWSFPRPDVVERWRTAGAQTLSTSRSGAIEVLVSATGAQPPKEFRVEHRRYWRSR
ncbi:MAG TPA: DNA internalization-related competence protein ComEC/Rec2 [Povalibacter sp.]|nr:DNA internalization-related competence protein ComEC/Rec2 [Povalibacter sp.]